MDYIREINFFGSNVSFTLAGKTSHKTLFGTFITIFILSLLTFLSYKNVYSYIYMTDPQTYIEEEAIETVQILDLKTADINFEVTTFHNSEQRYIDNNEVLDWFTPMAYSFEESGSDIKEILTPMVPCTPGKGVSTLSDFHAFCLPQDFKDSKRVLHSFDTEKQTGNFIGIKLFPCDKSTRICKHNKAEIDKLFIYFIYEYNFIQSKDRESPIKKQPQFISQQLSHLLEGVHTMKYNTLKINDEFGIEIPRYLKPQLEEKRGYQLNSIHTSTTTRFNQDLSCAFVNGKPDIHNCSPYVNFIVDFNKLLKTYNRAYIQILDLLGIIYGFFEFLIFLGIFLNTFYQNISFKYFMVNNVYGKKYIKRTLGIKSYCGYLGQTLCCCFQSKIKKQKYQRFQVCYESIETNFEVFNMIKGFFQDEVRRAYQMSPGLQKASIYAYNNLFQFREFQKEEQKITGKYQTSQDKNSQLNNIINRKSNRKKTVESNKYGDSKINKQIASKVLKNEFTDQGGLVQPTFKNQDEQELYDKTEIKNIVKLKLQALEVKQEVDQFFGFEQQALAQSMPYKGFQNAGVMNKSPRKLASEKEDFNIDDDDDDKANQQELRSSKSIRRSSNQLYLPSPDKDNQNQGKHFLKFGTLSVDEDDEGNVPEDPTSLDQSKGYLNYLLLLLKDNQPMSMKTILSHQDLPLPLPLISNTGNTGRVAQKAFNFKKYQNTPRMSQTIKVNQTNKANQMNQKNNTLNGQVDQQDVNSNNNQKFTFSEIFNQQQNVLSQQSKVINNQMVSQTINNYNIQEPKQQKSPFFKRDIQQKDVELIEQDKQGSSRIVVLKPQTHKQVIKKQGGPKSKPFRTPRSSKLGIEPSQKRMKVQSSAMLINLDNDEE